MAKFGWWSRTANPPCLIFPDFFHELPQLPLSGVSYLRGRWVAHFSICPSCPAASALLVSGHLQVLGPAPGVVPAHPPDRPNLVLLDCFYTTDLFGQSDASQVKLCLLQDGGTQSTPMQRCGYQNKPICCATVVGCSLFSLMPSVTLPPNTGLNTNALFTSSGL